MTVNVRNFVHTERKIQEDILNKIVFAFVRAHVGEIFLVIQNCLWGGWLFHFGAQSTRSTNPFDPAAYRAWACGSIFLGVLLAMAVAFEVQCAKKAALFLTMVWWVFVCFAFARMGVQVDNAPTYLSIAIAALLSYGKSELRHARKGTRCHVPGAGEKL